MPVCSTQDNIAVNLAPQTVGVEPGDAREGSFGGGGAAMWVKQNVVIREIDGQIKGVVVR